MAECLAHDGKRIEVIGVYTLAGPVFSGPKHAETSGPVRLMLGAERGPFLEPFWHDRAARPAEEISRFVGKQVRVRGVFHKSQPGNPEPRAASMGGSCVSDVEVEPA